MTIKKPSVQLALNGTPIYLNNIIMSLSVKREEKDMSGQKSSTKKSDKGIKAKELTVNGIIPYKCKEWLTDLFKLAEAEDEKGEQVKYRVSAIIAESVNMREVTFSDTITATEQQNNMAWQISFTLREVNSIAEKKEARKAKPQAKVQSEQAPVAKPQTQQTQDNQPEQEDNSFWKKLDDAVGEVRN